MITRSIQDYLKVIYNLTESGLPATTTDLARRLAVAPASVTGMLQKLASAGHPLVRYRKHQGARLTPQGRLAALEVIRRHRLIETWLVQSLGYSWDTVHGEAEVLEHVISEDFENRISAALGNPDRDPHGEPIPSSDLIMPSDPSTPLSDLRPGEQATVIRVVASEPNFLRYLASIGIQIGARLRILDVSPYDRVSRLRIGDRGAALTLGEPITRRVFVEVAHGAPRSRSARQPAQLQE